MDDISNFTDSLRKRKQSSTVFNPYLDKNLANNLELYLRLIKSQKSVDVLLVGEAPGHLGCKLTGIPFTSGEAVMKIEHPILQKLRSRIHLDQVTSETTANIAWEFLSTKNSNPLFWNSFPFHPHPSGNLEVNRTPSNAEVSEGVKYLQEIYRIFKPGKVIGLGRKGERCAKIAFPELDIPYVRHPARGGKSHFMSGLDVILT